MQVLTRAVRLKTAREARKIKFNYCPRTAAVIKQMEPGDCVRVYNHKLSEATVRATARHHGTRIRWKTKNHGYIKGDFTCFWLLYPVIPDDEIEGKVGLRQDKAGLAVRDWNPPAGWEELVLAGDTKIQRRRVTSNKSILSTPESLVGLPDVKPSSEL